MSKKDRRSLRYSGVNRRDFRADGSGPEEIPHRSPSNKKRSLKGCPENNSKSHIYVTQVSDQEASRPAMKKVPGGNEIIGWWVSTLNVTTTICVGCGHVKDTEVDYLDGLNNQRFRAINISDQHLIGS